MFSSAARGFGVLLAGGRGRPLFGLVGCSMLVVLALGGVAPAVASGAPLTLGSNNAAAAAGEHCSNKVSWVQRATASGSPSYTVPSEGTITSWTTSSGANASTAALKIWQPTSNPNQFVPVAQSATVSVPGGNTLKTFSTSLHVLPGDVIGVATFSGNALSCLYFSPSANAGDVASYVLGDPTSGTQTVTDCLGLGCSGGTASRLNVSVTFQPRSGGRIFWEDFNSNVISFANLAGGHGGDLNTTGETPAGPAGIAMDLLSNKIYWADFLANTISFANLDDTGGGGQLDTTGATAPVSPAGVAILPQLGKLYWADDVPGGPISFANLDDSGGGGDQSISGGATVYYPNGIAIDVEEGNIYWANTSANRISFTSLPGLPAGGGDLNTTGATVNNPQGVAIDPANGKIYWANGNDNTHPISFANLNDTGHGGNLNVSGASPNDAMGVAIDPYARKIYWGNYSGDTISFAHLNGSGGGQLNTSGASTLDGSIYPVLLKVPRATSSPEIFGGSTVGSTLSCSEGLWAPDLQESFLYQRPVSFSYAWSLNGTPISGATTTSITAATAGAYTCTVTAENQAGFTKTTSVSHNVS